MLDRLELAKRLKAAMTKAGMRNVALADALNVTEQAVGQWLKGGKIQRDRIPAIAAALRCSADWLLTGQEPKKSQGGVAVTPDGEQISVTDTELDVLRGYRTLSAELQTAVWDIIDGHLRRQFPDVAAQLGRRDVEASKRAEPGIVTRQIVQRARPSQSEKARRPSKGAKRSEDPDWLK